MRLAKLNPGFVNAGANLTVSKAIHDGKTIKLSNPTGSVVLIPAAVGGGAKYRFVVGPAPTSGSFILRCQNTNDQLVGIVQGFAGTGNGVLAFSPAIGNDQITLDRTNGAVRNGEWIEFEDLTVGQWTVRGMVSTSGAAFATPFGNQP